MSEKRKDNKGRLLHPGEIQMPDGRYRYKYVDSYGKERAVYSTRLDVHDYVPTGKKKVESLREKEKRIQAEMILNSTVVPTDMTVYQLAEAYINTRNGVKLTTKYGYQTVMNFLKKDPFGARKINSIKVMEAKNWLISLQKSGKSFSSIHTIKGVLGPAFRMALDDDLVRKNPFDFPLGAILVDDKHTRDALTREEERKFLKFIQEDEHFSQYYDGIWFLLNTGLRISEFCGLTLSNIDFKNHKLTIDHQLQKRAKVGYYIETPKTSNGVRIIPLLPEVEECLKRIVENRNAPKVEPIIEGYSGFLFFDKKGDVVYSLHWDHYFRHIVEKYNSIYKVQLPPITPHVCRHTYCSRLAMTNINPKALQYIMGHSDIATTMNIYTHVKFENAQEELAKVSANQLKTGSV